MKKHLIIVVFVSSYFFIFGNWLLSITSPDEGKNLDASLRMIETKDFIVPRYNCESRFEKPPMFYWLTDVSFFLFGVNEFSARLVSGLSAVATDLTTWMLAFEVLDPELALLSALVFDTFPHNWIEARGATPEMLLTFFMTLGLYLFVKGRFLLGWVALALAFLTKGPVGVILPVGAYLLWKRDFRFLNLKGIMLFLLIGFSWYGVMLYRFGFEYFYKFFLHENVMRFTGHKSIHPYPFWYYLPIIAVSSFLYLPLIPRMLRSWDKRLNPLLLWFLLVLIFYSLSKNKLHHYVLFLYPPLAIIFARYLGRRYAYASLLIAFSIITVLFVYAPHVEAKRFVPKAVELLKERKGESIYFYRTELSSVVFYVRACIPKLNDPQSIPPGSLVITRDIYLKDLKNAKVLLRGDEFGRRFILVETGRPPKG